MRAMGVPERGGWRGEGIQQAGNALAGSAGRWRRPWAGSSPHRASVRASTETTEGGSDTGGPPGAHTSTGPSTPKVARVQIVHIGYLT
jgi:hypothetical protein